MKQDTIDKYILGKMSNEERLAFEKEIAQDDNLREEVSVQREIIQAIRMKAAKEHLQAVERKIQANERRRKVFAIRITSVAIAACLVLGVFFHVDTVTAYRDCGMSIQSEIIAERGGVRGGEKYSDRVIDAMESGNYELALNIIREGETIEFTFDDSNPTLQEQARIEYNIEQNDLKWFKAITYMRMGKWIKAKRLLKEIAASDSYYKTKAQEVLKKL
jgi:hypothetical protein